MSAIIPAGITTLKDVVFTVDGDDYEAALSQVVLTPQTNTATWQGLTPAAKYTDIAVTGWTCQTTNVQDWDDPDSFSNYCLANAGQTKSVTFRPRRGGVGFTVQLIIAPPTIGGQVNQWATSQITHGVEGEPAQVAAPAPEE